jgi:hypothetical protein
MAISTPVLVNGTWFDTANQGGSGSPYLTSSGSNTYTVQLVAGRRYYMVVQSFSSGAAERPNLVVHDQGGTSLAFGLVLDGTNQADISGYGVTGNRISVWEANVTSTTATAAITIQFPATQSACGAGLFYIDGEDDTNTTVQVVLQTGTGTLPGLTMASFGATDNLALLIIATDSPTNTISATESRTKLYENNETERNNHAVFYQNPHGGDVSLNASITSDSWAAIGLEIRAAGGGPVAVSGSDSATLSEARLTSVAWNLRETVTLTDAGVGLLALTPTGDSAALTEGTPVVVGSGLGADTATESEALTALLATLTASDTGTLSEAASATVSLTVADTLALLESAAISGSGPAPNNPIVGDDLSTLTDAMSGFLALTPTGDASVLADAAVAQLNVTVSDALTLTDTRATIPLDLTSTDNAAVSEALAFTAAWTAHDTFAVTDAASIFVPSTFEGEATMGRVGVGARVLGG